MRLGSQVQLLRSGDKEKGAFRKQTTSALPCSTPGKPLEEDRGLNFCPFPRRTREGRPSGPGLKHLRSSQIQDAPQLGHWAWCTSASRQNQASPGEQDTGCSIAAILQAQQATLLSPSSAPPPCHLESPAAIPRPTTCSGWLSLHRGKVNKAAGMSLPCPANVGQAGQNKPKLRKILKYGP